MSDLDNLNWKLDRLDRKIDDSVKRLDDKISSSEKYIKEDLKSHIDLEFLKAKLWIILLLIINIMVTMASFSALSRLIKPA